MDFRSAIVSVNGGPPRSSKLSLIVALLLVSALVNVTGSSQTRPPKRTGSITGQVVGEDGRAIEGATVYCNTFDGTAGYSDVTDAEGQFSFSGLSPSTYRLVAFLPGYVSEAGVGSDRIVRIGDNVTLNVMKGGVITGKVTDATGNPVVGVSVSARLTKDANGKAPRTTDSSRSRQTDDRGIYRLYGLRAGTYVVVANPGESRSPLATAYDFEIATYHPSSNREGADEVAVHQGTEATSIDIRYREVRGYTISGTIEAGSQTTSNEFSVTVRANPANGLAPSDLAGSTLVDGVRVFSINGVSDGEYDIAAGGGTWSTAVREIYGGPSRRVTVRGGDVGGVKLTIAPGVSIAGKVAVETLPIRPENCPPVRESSLTETLVKSVRDEKDAEVEPFGFLASRGTSPINDKSEFFLLNLKPGTHRLLSDLPNDFWFLKSVTMPAANGSRRVDLGRVPLATRSGDKVANVNMILGEGAAGLRGRLSSVRVKKGLWRMHLVPVEVGDADNAISYYESISSVDGGFAFTNLAPGKYRISARLVGDDETLGSQIRPVAWDAAERAKLRREAEATKNVIDLKACERVKDFVLE